MSEEELAIEVAKIDCIQVYDMNFAKACQDQVLEQLTSYTTGADHQNTRLRKV